MRILGRNDPPPVDMAANEGASPFLLVCDHAGRGVPDALNGLGLPLQELDRHIGWDIGAGEVTRRLAARLGAGAILQAYSRLVVDCNRRPGHPTSIAPVSDGTVIPRNQDLSEEEREARYGEIFRPYHDAITAALDQRASRRQPALLISVHSFTPVMGGRARPWQAGVLHNRDPRLARAVASLLTQDGFLVGDNEPYALGDDSDYTIPVHAEARGLPYLELEIRQDLIGGEAGQEAWATRLSRVLPSAARVLEGQPA